MTEPARPAGIPDDARWRFDHDHHMTPAAHAVIARRLYFDAGLASPMETASR